LEILDAVNNAIAAEIAAEVTAAPDNTRRLQNTMLDSFF